MDYGTGRINEVIDFLENKHNKKITLIDVNVKVAALCDALKIDEKTLDHIIADHSPVLRTVKGHTFESFFDLLLRENNIAVKEVGGDQAIDRIVNGYSLQLKTPTLAGTRGNLVQFKTHKTHGAKSEQESMDYYHHIDEFPDFLIGLVTYEPLKILVIKKENLPRHARDSKYIMSPFVVDITKTTTLNNFAAIDINAKLSNNTTTVKDKELLEKTSRAIGITTDVIVNAILSRENFRIWDMSIRGFSKEVIFINKLKEHNIILLPPQTYRQIRADKADHAVNLKDGKIKFIQMKGVSTNNCDFFAKDPIISVETQLTRGRVNDHPTQSRLYLRTDFDFLTIGLDPSIVKICQSSIGNKNLYEWEFYMIPIHELESHHVISHRLKSLQVFKYSSIQKYKINDWSLSDL
jgi:hypothetical protein